MAVPPSVSGTTPLGGCRKSHKVDLAMLPDCPVSAIHTAVRSVTAWASAIAAAARAKVMACVSSAYPVGHTAAIPAPWGSSADGIPSKGGLTLRGGSRRVATTTCWHISSISIFQMDVGRLMRTTLRGHHCRMPLVARHHSPRLPASRKARPIYRYMAARARGVPVSMPSFRATRSTTVYGIMSKHLTEATLRRARFHPLSQELKEDGRHPCPIYGPPAGAEAVGLRVGPGLLPEQYVPQPGPCPQPVDHGQDCQRAGAQGALLPGFRDEGRVSLRKHPRPLALALHQLQQLGQPVQSGSDRRSCRLQPSNPMEEGDMARRRLPGSPLVI